jgi:hypothetical protein
MSASVRRGNVRRQQHWSGSPPTADGSRSKGGAELGSGWRKLFLSLRSYFLKFLAGCLKGGLQPAHRTKTAQAHIAIEVVFRKTKRWHHTCPGLPVPSPPLKD